MEKHSVTFCHMSDAHVIILQRKDDISGCSLFSYGFLIMPKIQDLDFATLNHPGGVTTVCCS